jgi:hypothetical protein
MVAEHLHAYRQRYLNQHVVVVRGYHTIAVFAEMNTHSTKVAPFRIANADMSVSGVTHVIPQHARCDIITR